MQILHSNAANDLFFWDFAKVRRLRAPRIVRRKRLRLRDFDYSSNGAYFVTVCVEMRRPLFDGEIKLLIEQELLALPARFPGVTIDAYVVMTDHVHAIVLMCNCRSALPRIMQAFKSLSTARVKQRMAIDRVWQRGYFDRIIRNECELAALREYIQNNPLGKEIRDQEG